MNILKGLLFAFLMLSGLILCAIADLLLWPGRLIKKASTALWKKARRLA
jgi:hypothetical protein